MEHKEAADQRPYWEKGNWDKAYWEVKLAGLKEKRTDIHEHMNELAERYRSGEISEKQYSDAMNVLQEDLQRTEAEIEALEETLSSGDAIKITSADTDTSGHGVELSASYDSAPDIDVAEFVAHAVEHFV